MIKKMKKGEENVAGVLDSQLADVLTNCIDDVFVVLNVKNLSVEYVSPNVERVLGVAQEDVEDDIKSIGKAKYLDDSDVNLETLKSIEVGSSKSFAVGREHGLTKDMRFFRETVYHIDDEGVEKYVVIFSDKTSDMVAKQSLEEALNIAKIANRSKSTFLANLSHDISTPTESIAWLCSQLQKEIDGDDRELTVAHTKQLMLTSRQLLTTLNDVIDMSKLESGETPLSFAEINLIDLIKELDAAISPQAKAKRQQFKITVALRNENVFGDKLRVKRVLLNVLSNAVKYTQEGGHITMTVQQVANSSRKYSFIQFIVKDDGVGMSEDFIKRIFEPYSRSISEAELDINGSGLGMAVAKNLIDIMGGTISVDSKVGEGSTFAVNLKFANFKDDDADFWIERGVARVLVVGDNNAANNSVTWEMRKCAVAISTAKGFKSAASTINKALSDGKGFNVVLYDWLGSDEESLEFVRKLRGEIPGNVPVVALGKCANEENTALATEAGVLAFMQKPFTVENFKECVASLNLKKCAAVSLDEEKSPLYGKRFLAAEDNELNAMVLAENLNMLGAICVTVPNGKEAVDAFVKSAAGEYDGILMDIKMPEMDGFEATKAIRKSAHPEAKTIPIIAMTANAYAEDVKKSLDIGMNAYMFKPLDRDKLEETYSAVKQNSEN